MNYDENFKEMEEKGFDWGQAVAEANRCLLCYDPPCSKGCPAETDPGTFIRKLRLKNVTGAVRTVKENNILGGSCGVLCPTPLLCELECSATEIDRPIQIGKIQRFLVEHAFKTGFKVFEKPAADKEKVAVVGSGPAGLSCAAELAKDGYRVTIFEAKAKPGGVLAYGVPSYRLSEDFFAEELKDITDLGVEIKCNTPVDKKGGAEKLLEEGFKAVFLAPGLWEPIRLNEKSREIDGVYTATEFLAALRNGKHEEFGKKIDGKSVAVIGGGSVAIDSVEASRRLNAKDVYLVYRRSFLQMPAEETERVEALQDGIQFLLLNQPVDYITENGKLRGLKLVRTKLGDKDSSGRRKPVEIPGSEWVLDADVVIEAIGSRAVEDSTDWYPSVKTNEKKYIVADKETGATSVKGIFAGGDIVRGPALVVEAVQDGKVAARAIKKYLRGEE